ncbi:hypothetical protein [Natronomonas marina]|jgi:hypothetical protein|uniref:hypothetical protein n=1 Tax=Natronomonas marina TaxID=2961939 RepID=UPI0020C980BD|nr:hypothetical protein [Natronomonas marina]
MARKLAHEDDGESGEATDTGGKGGLLLDRRRYVKLGAAAVGVVATGSWGGTAQSGGTTYWTDFSEGQL